MITSMKINNKMTMLSEMRNDTIFQILEYDNLDKLPNIDYIRNIKDVRLKQARIILDNSKIKIGPGLLSYMKGNVNISNKSGGVKSLTKKIFANKNNNKAEFKLALEGTGEIFLKPSFNYYTLLELEDETIIVNDNLFCACEDSVDVVLELENNFTRETKLSGSGIVLLLIPVPEREVLRCKMYKDTLKIDGELALLRTGNVDYEIEKSESEMIGSIFNGEAIINVYKGCGEVWIAPTKNIYEEILIDKNLNEKERYDD